MSVAATRTCDLCGLPARSPVTHHSEQMQRTFCCMGCKNVWQILEEGGYLAGGTDPRQSPIFLEAQRLGLLGGDSDSPSSQPSESGVAVQPERAGSSLSELRRCVLRIDGMWCVSCAWLIGHVLATRPGVVSAQVSFSSDTARITYRPARVGEDDLRRTVTSLGYQAQPLGEADESDPKVRARRVEVLRMGVAFTFAMNVMMINVILYAGYFNGLPQVVARAVPWLLLLLSVPVFACAWPLFDRAVRAARRGAATMETLVCLGATAALAYSVAQVLAGSLRVYFDTADMLLALVLVGKYIEGGARAGASDALALLYNLLPRKATVLRDGREALVKLQALAEGDRVLVRPGERIPADGVVEEGRASVDESLMTGEARPAAKGPGDLVTGGAIAMDGALTIRVTRGPDSGSVAQMIDLVEDALHKKTPAERLADRISRFFVPAVVCLALIAAAGALAAHAPAWQAMTRGVATLVIACPCALGIATPMAIMAGVGAAAQRGVLIADAGALETLARLTRLVFDKTGTLTEGRFAVRAVYPEGTSLADLAAMERLSEHPIARAISRSAEGETPADASEFERVEGLGIRATVADRLLFAGNARLVAECGLAVSGELAKRAQTLEEAGLTVVFWGEAYRQVHGLVALGDCVRAEARRAIEALTARGISCELVSGDSEATVRAIAGELGITTWRAQVTPQDKAEWVAQRAGGCVVGMVGDGVNDAPALARADVGIALAEGADIAAKAAQVTLLSPDLTRIPWLLTLAQKTGVVMRQNLFWAFLYNVVCIPLAMLGYVNPLWAAAAMLLSSFTVILNTKRLQKMLRQIDKSQDEPGITSSP